MGEDLQILRLPLYGLQHLDYLWTFTLLLTRFGGFMLIVPGLGGGARGMVIRLPAIIIFSVVSMISTKPVPIPPNEAMLAAGLLSEMMLGMLLGAIPLLLVSGAQMAGQLASTSMGLAAAQQLDPTTGGQASDLARIYGDLVAVTFLILGGQYVLIYAVSGLGGHIVPGTFIVGERSLELFIDRFSYVLTAGVMMSAPVIVALLLTQFVMGLISKAVPTVNIFIVSFPLTIGIGLILSILALPDLMTYVIRDITGVETVARTVLMDTQHR